MQENSTVFDVCGLFHFAGIDEGQKELLLGDQSNCILILGTVTLLVDHAEK